MLICVFSGDSSVHLPCVDVGVHCFVPSAKKMTHLWEALGMVSHSNSHLPHIGVLFPHRYLQYSTPLQPIPFLRGSLTYRKWLAGVSPYCSLFFSSKFLTPLCLPIVLYPVHSPETYVHPSVFSWHPHYRKLNGPLLKRVSFLDFYSMSNAEGPLVCKPVII